MKEVLKITDKHGFVYEVEVNYHPNKGSAFAEYRDRIIGDCDLGFRQEPTSDNDKEWEEYEEALCLWKDEINTNLIHQCKDYFDNKTH